MLLQVGVQTSIFTTTWELVGNVSSGPPPHSLDWNLGTWGPGIRVLTMVLVIMRAVAVEIVPASAPHWGRPHFLALLSYGYKIV